MSFILRGIGYLFICNLLNTQAFSAESERLQVNTITMGGSTYFIVDAAHEAFPARQKALLQQKITLHAEDLPLTDVLEQIARVTSCNIIIDPAVREEQLNITLNLKNMSAETVLYWACKLGSAYMTGMDGGIYISYEKPRPIKSAKRFLDVTALAHPVPDFAGPRMGIPTPGDGMSSTSFEFNDNSNEVDEEQIERIRELLERTINKE